MSSPSEPRGPSIRNVDRGYSDDPYRPICYSSLNEREFSVELTDQLAEQLETLVADPVTDHQYATVAGVIEEAIQQLIEREMAGECPECGQPFYKVTKQSPTQAVAFPCGCEAHPAVLESEVNR